MSTTVRRAVRGAVALLLGATLAVAALIVGAVPPAHAAPVVAQPGELVINGGGEQPVTVGWQGQLGRATHGAGGYPPSNIVDANGLTGASYEGGTYLLAGTGATSTATQTIDLTPSAAAIDNGSVDALLSVYIGGYATQRDNAEVTYAFFDAAGTELDSVVFGPVLPADRGSISGFVPFADTVRLPSSTRSAVVTIRTQRFVAPANDGYVDNVSLILDAPSPMAVPDTARTDQGVPVTVDAAANDAPGAGAQIMPTSVRLLDGGIEVTSLTTSEGTYTVDIETGTVEFAPLAGFFGTTTPVPYRIHDSSGQRADSTITIEVVFVPAPGLSLVKSATPSDPEDFTVGTEITYSFVVTNTGNVRVDDVGIAEHDFSGAGATPVAECPAGSIEPGAQMTCTAKYTLVQEDIDNQGVDNAATVSGTPFGLEDPVASDPSEFRIPVASAPAISLVKSAEPGRAINAGDEVGYSFLVTNTGNVTVDTVSISEISFSGAGELSAVRCPTGSLLPGAFITCTAEYSLTQADIDAGNIVNTALANAAFGSESVASAPSSASVSIAARPAIHLSKTTDSTVVTAAGQVIDYVFRVSNTGNVTVSNVVIDETAFSGDGELSEVVCPSSTVAPGDDLVCTASYAVVGADLTETTLSNSAKAGADAQGVTLSSDISTAVVSIDASVPEVPGPDEDGGPDPSAGSPGSGRLPATGADIAWPVIAGAVLSLLLGGGLLVGNRRSRRRS